MSHEEVSRRAVLAPAVGQPRVLVLLACRNGASWIRAQIDSVLAQTGVDVQLLVRDDGSTDATRDAVAASATADARVSLWPDHAATGSASANFFALMDFAGPRLASCDYVAFCDQDDEWLPHKLERAVTQLRAQAAAGYSAAVLARWSDGRTATLAQSARTRRADYLFEGAGQGCTFVIDALKFAWLRRELIARADLLPSVHYHDWTVHALLRSVGERWVFDAEPVLIYRQHGGNDTGARNSGDGVARRVKLIRSGWYRAQVDAVVRLVLQVNPGDTAAAAWARLDSAPARRSWLARCRRLAFVVRQGRRRPVDRVVLAAAVLLGYL